ncbi:MAG: T9SS type A sorting domain-containing protein, partial [Bacteroidota bacterium]
IGQANLVLTGGHLVLTDSFLVLDDANLINNASFKNDNAKVLFLGTMNSNIGGSSMTTFDTLWINKSSGDLLLGNGATVKGKLNLINGKIDVGTNNLTLINTAKTVQGAAADRYVKTSSTGYLVIEVDGTEQAFPVGVSSYNPAAITNDGTKDTFSVRVLDQILENADMGAPITFGFVERTWEVKEKTTGGSNLDIELQWNGAEEQVGFDNTNAKVGRYDDASSMAWIGGTAGSATGSDPFQLSRALLMEDGFFAVGAANVVPVEMLFFSAEADGDHSLLTWATTTEINNLGFEILRSTDYSGWEVIGFVDGNGTTNERQDYEFVDENPYNGNNYYQLRQIDLDGTATLSNIEQVFFDFISLNVYPNPTSEMLYFNISNPQQFNSVMIFDMNGAMVRKSFEINGQFSLLGLANGTYHLVVEMENQSFNYLIIKADD